VAVGKIQFEQNDRRLSFGERRQPFREQAHTVHYHGSFAFHQPQPNQVSIARIVFNQQNVFGTILRLTKTYQNQNFPNDAPVMKKTEMKK
jgi:hypothetical protein